MIELGLDAALLVVGAAVLAVVGWGASLSARSAVRGPAWALTHLGSAARGAVAGAGLGLVLAVVVRPVWIGAGVLYAAGMAWWLIVTVRRNLSRLESLGGLEDMPPERRRAIVARARTGLLATGGVLGAIGLVAASHPVGWVTLALGAVLAVTGVTLRTPG